MIVIWVVNGIVATATATALLHCNSNTCGTSVTTTSSVSATGTFAVAAMYGGNDATVSHGTDYTLDKGSTGISGQTRGVEHSSILSGNTNFPFSTDAQFPGGSESGAVFAASTVTQPIKATLLNTGGTTQTVTVTGSCGQTPSTFSGDGSAHDITMNPTCAFGLSLPSGYIFFGGTGTTSCGSGSCTEYDTTYGINAESFSALVKFQATYSEAATLQSTFTVLVKFAATETGQAGPLVNLFNVAVKFFAKTPALPVLSEAFKVLVKFTSSADQVLHLIFVQLVFDVVQPNPLTIDFWIFPFIIMVLFTMMFLLIAARHGATTWARNYMLLTGLVVGMLMAIVSETLPYPVLILGVVMWFLYAYRG